MAKLLTQDYDGQISLVVPEEARVEKQITGQMNIDEVLVEWEKTKKEYEEKRKAKLTQKVLAQTGSMFSDFDAKVRDGILEQLTRNGDVLDMDEGCFAAGCRWQERSAGNGGADREKNTA